MSLQIHFVTHERKIYIVNMRRTRRGPSVPFLYLTIKSRRRMGDTFVELHELVKEFEVRTSYTEAA
jgi:hypothetical protein